MTFTPPAPGLVPVFPGWNVWAVYQKDDLDIELTMVGLDADRRLRIWVENQVQDNAPGAAVSDPWSPNPEKFVGDQVQILPDAAGLTVVMAKETVPGATLLLDGPATLRFVRFYNRGLLTTMPWPHDSNYLLGSVYLPDASNAVTNSPPPATTAATATAAADAAADAAKSIGSGVAIAAGVALGVVILVALARRHH